MPTCSRILAACDFIRFTDHTICDKAAYVAELQSVKKTGIAFDNEETVSGLSCVAGPIFNNSGDCIASISLSGNAFRVNSKRDEIINAVKYVCARISEQMGYRPGARAHQNPRKGS